MTLKSYIYISDQKKNPDLMWSQATVCRYLSDQKPQTKRLRNDPHSTVTYRYELFIYLENSFTLHCTEEMLKLSDKL